MNEKHIVKETIENLDKPADKIIMTDEKKLKSFIFNTMSEYKLQEMRRQSKQLNHMFIILLSIATALTATLIATWLLLK